MKDQFDACYMTIQPCGTTIEVPEPKPKPKSWRAAKTNPNEAPKPGPNGQHKQEFRMVYHRNKGFMSVAHHTS